MMAFDDVTRSNTSWECLSGMKQCFKDCCVRGIHFCNHVTERCDHCSTREVLCGSDQLPQDCDLFCFKKTLPADSMADDCVHPVYFYSTCFLGFVLAVVVMVLIIYCIRAKRKRHSNNLMDSLESASLTDSTLANEKDVEEACPTQLTIINPLPKASDLLDTCLQQSAGSVGTDRKSTAALKEEVRKASTASQQYVPVKDSDDNTLFRSSTFPELPAHSPEHCPAVTCNVWSHLHTVASPHCDDAPIIIHTGHGHPLCSQVDYFTK